MFFKLREVTDDSVVGEQPSVHFEGMGVASFRGRTGAVAQVCQEGAAVAVLCFLGECGVLESCDGFFLHAGQSIRIESSKARAIWVAVGLKDEAIWGIEKPKRRAHALPPCA